MDYRWLGVLLLSGGALTGCATTSTTASGPTGHSASAVPVAGMAHKESVEGQASSTLAALIAEHWQERLRRDPLLATQTGKFHDLDQLPDVSLQAQRAAADTDRDYLERLSAIERSALGDQDRVTYDVFRWETEQAVAAFDSGNYRFPINADSGFHTALARLPTWVPLKSVEHYEAYIARLEAVPLWFEQHQELLDEAIASGWTQPTVVLEGYEVTIASHVVDRAEDSVFYAPFESFPVGVPAAEHERLRSIGRQAVLDGPVAAYGRFLEYFRSVYMPATRDQLGISSVPGGEDYYQNRISYFTTLELSPKEIHEIGLGEVARIRVEMDEVIASTGFEGTFAEFLAFLRSDPQFYAKTPEELLQRASRIAKRMDGALPSLFSHWPRQPYGVEPVPDYLAPKYTAGRYVSAPIDGQRAGTYWVNTYALETRSLYTLEALSLHEAVPGHHFQFALSAELDLPPFRRELYISAFGEGWGLYSERLGLEAGFYKDPYSNFGRLTYEMWRACRLVVDTGVHAFDWSRQQAIDYLAENTALSIHEVTTEVDRYISWPAQALSYKLGELRIRELRARAEEIQGQGFDIRLFHDQLLRNGAVPLSVLESEMERWWSER